MGGALSRFAEAGRRGQGLRGRLLAAFVLVAVPPLLLFAVFVMALVSDRLERAARQRLGQGLDGVRARVSGLQRQADAAVAAIVREKLSSAAVSEEKARAAADELGASHGLPVLEIIDGSGRVLSSRLWPAGVGLPEGDREVAGTSDLRWETVAEDYGAAERLAVVATRPGTWAGTPVVVRGGFPLDATMLGELSDLMGAEVALRDTARGRWVARAGSPLAKAAAFDPSKGDGTADISGAVYRWAAAPLGASLWEVVAVPHTLLADVTGGVRWLTLGVAVLALLAALTTALVLSGRIAGPVRALAARARDVGAGDLEHTAVEASDEVGELARAFASMTHELRTSRERLVQAERVAAWREMARRLAHELKNPIFPIQLSIETLRRALDQEGAQDAQRFQALFRESSDTILDELRSLRSIVEEFSQFARMPPPRLAPTDVGDLVERVLALYRARAAAVRIETGLAPGLPAVPADRDLLGRALGNLVANALEAMPDGGTLSVKTRAVEEGVALEVSDTGPGLTEEQRTRLFTPYYTTKKGGTGLGLAIVQGIVSDHGGRIQVESAPGAGTTFTLVLPVRIMAEAAT
ncbi:MAG TPA: ATP-binding protein [Vicinamibacteria bacterium]|nr:ATP-binding protein [Vicinamibacteria bacterium]